jgi:outer membrane protein assembly factor BamB
MKTTRCWLSALCLALAAAAARADDWPQWLGPQRDGVWRETGLLDKFPAGGPKVLWRVKVGGGYAGPAVAGGRVYVTDYVTDADLRKLNNPVGQPKVNGKERVLCLDAKDGKELWKYEYDCPYAISYPAGPRCTPTVADGKVYTLGAMGNLLCLDAAKGTLLWSKDFPKDYGAKVPRWGFAGHPLVDGRKLICIVGGKGSVAVAFDKDTSKELWKALSASEQGYSAPVVLEAGGKRQLVIWDADAIHGLGPETGQVYWSAPLKPSYGMSIATPRRQGEYLFAGGMVGKAVLLRLAADRPAVEEVWRGDRDTGVYPSNSTPALDDGTIYGCDCMQGDLRAVELKTGKVLWKTFAPVAGKRETHGTAFLVKNGDRYFLFNEKGELIIARLTPKGYEEVSRATLLAPTGEAFGRDVLWSHPAFAGRCVFARNDKEIVCASLAKE